MIMKLDTYSALKAGGSFLCLFLNGKAIKKTAYFRKAYSFVIIENTFEYTDFSKTSPNKSNNGFCVN